MSAAAGGYVVLGRVAGLFGVRGWVRVLSYTEPREAILRYGEWYVLAPGGERRLAVRAGKQHGKGIVALLEGCAEPQDAAPLIGADVAVTRESLPPLGPGEVYWADLEGLRVVTTSGVDLGHVHHLIETGANDVLVVRAADRERLVPWIADQVVHAIDLEGGVITVDWDPEF